MRKFVFWRYTVAPRAYKREVKISRVKSADVNKSRSGVFRAQGDFYWIKKTRRPAKCNRVASETAV